MLLVFTSGETTNLRNKVCGIPPVGITGSDSCSWKRKELDPGVPWCGGSLTWFEGQDGSLKNLVPMRGRLQ
nr:MAG: hypothetical protein H2Rhizo31887_000001 [Mitovirus sp.]